MATGRRPKGATTRQSRNWSTIGLEIVWSKAGKTISHEGADLELDALANGEPVKGVSDERRDMGKLRNAPYEPGRSIKDGLKLRCIYRGEANVDRIPIINPSADQSMDQSRDSM